MTSQNTNTRFSLSVNRSVVDLNGVVLNLTLSFDKLIRKKTHGSIYYVSIKLNQQLSFRLRIGLI